MFDPSIYLPFWAEANRSLVQNSTGGGRRTRVGDNPIGGPGDAVNGAFINGANLISVSLRPTSSGGGGDRRDSNAHTGTERSEVPRVVIASRRYRRVHGRLD